MTGLHIYDIHNICSLFWPTIRLLCCSQPLIRLPSQHFFPFKRTHYLSKLILWWCMPPALPRPPGCFLCLPADTKHITPHEERSSLAPQTCISPNLPTRPCPWLTCPRSFLVLDVLVGCQRRHRCTLSTLTTVTASTTFRVASLQASWRSTHRQVQHIISVG